MGFSAIDYLPKQKQTIFSPPSAWKDRAAHLQQLFQQVYHFLISAGRRGPVDLNDVRILGFKVFREIFQTNIDNHKGLLENVCLAFLFHD